MQQQFMMMNLMSMGNVGASYLNPKNNMFVRRAKGAENRGRGKRNGQARQGRSDGNEETKGARIRLDSDNFPSLDNEPEVKDIDAPETNLAGMDSYVILRYQSG